MHGSRQDDHVLASVRRNGVRPDQNLNTAPHHTELLHLFRVQVRPRAAADVGQGNQALGLLPPVIRPAEDLDVLPA
jgi:hypothetical protein